MTGLSADDLGIPTLDISMQAAGLVAPVTKWGTIARSAPMPGTYHFYTANHQFSAVLKHPTATVEQEEGPAERARRRAAATAAPPGNSSDSFRNGWGMRGKRPEAGVNEVVGL